MREEIEDVREEERSIRGRKLRGEKQTEFGILRRSSYREALYCRTTILSFYGWQCDRRKISPKMIVLTEYWCFSLKLWFLFDTRPFTVSLISYAPHLGFSIISYATSPQSLMLLPW